MTDQKSPLKPDHIDSVTEEKRTQDEARAHRQGGGSTLKQKPAGSTVKEETPVETSLRGTEDAAPSGGSTQGSPD